MKSPIVQQLSMTCVESPTGSLKLAATSVGVVKLGFPRGPRSDFNAWIQRYFPGVERVASGPWLEAARVQLGAYFAGNLREFTLAMDLRGTSFQIAVWSRLAKIPYGETCTYGELAADLGRPGAARAVGAAVGANPLPLLLPCHRVIAAGGRLGGFGGGLETKRKLLAFEGMAQPLLSAS